MSMTSRLLLTIATYCLLFGLGGGTRTAATQKSGQPTPRAIPGITADDRYPGACVDCHLNSPEMKVDSRFSTIMARWRTVVEPDVLAKVQATAPPGMTLKGRHPAVPASMQIPSGCMPCHGKASKMAPALGPMLHALHLTGGKDNTFLTAFQGECTYCHKLDRQTGQWTIPSGREK